MSNDVIRDIIEAHREIGWVLEPEAKRALKAAGVAVPRFGWARTIDEARDTAAAIGFPGVVKRVSPKALHKSDVGGVSLGIADDAALKMAFERYSGFEPFHGVLIEETVSGIELILGMKNDFQFGPVILLGMGGTGVEVYRDTAIRMAPLTAPEVRSMLDDLKAGVLLKGYRGTAPVNQDALIELTLRFSDLAMALADDVSSIDLNPVMCNENACIVADARMVLTTSG